MRSLELKIPPPLVALLVAAAMWLAARATTPVNMPLSVRVALAVVFGMLGIAFAGSGAVAFGHARTTRNPIRPEAASSLVCTGPYRFTRNPMYLGLSLLLLAWAAALASALAVLGPFFFAAYIGRFQIRPEERALEKLFGADYEKYKQQVRRWI